eukprot:m.332376 g.332376  ORF g.332376 m.332376 type:complete len:132 (+) comp16941_c0_seq1:129-524(+)
MCFVTGSRSHRLPPRPRKDPPRPPLPPRLPPRPNPPLPPPPRPPRAPLPPPLPPLPPLPLPPPLDPAAPGKNLDMGSNLAASPKNLESFTKEDATIPSDSLIEKYRSFIGPNISSMEPTCCLLSKNTGALK